MSLTPRTTRRRPSSPEDGLTLIEMMAAMVVVLIGALGTLTTMVSSATLQEELEEKATALEASREVIETIRTYDYQGELSNLVAYWSDPTRSTFTVAGLRPPANPSANQQANVAATRTGASGSIFVDTSDPDVVRLEVTLRWGARRGDREVSLAMLMTEVTP